MLIDDVKLNLRILDSADDATIESCIASAIGYAEDFQNKPEGYYASNGMPESTWRAVVLLASHYYESPDGATGGFMNDSPAAAQQTMAAVNNLLQLRKEWRV